MSLNLGVMSAAVTLDDADYRRKLAGLEGSSNATFKKIAQMAAGYLTLRAIVEFGNNAIRTFSDLQEETNKFNVVFQNLGAESSRVLTSLKKEFGLSELAAKKMLAGTGDILTGFGFDKNTALALSEGAAKLGADIASFSNYSGGAEGATSALTKAMLGETESAKMLGVVIRQDNENYKSLVKQAMTTGVTIDALGKTFTVQSEQQAKAVASLALAYQQSPNAIGDFVRSQDSIANQTRILQNNFQQLYATIGDEYSGAYHSALQFSNSLLKTYNELSPVTSHLVNNAALLSAALLLTRTRAVQSANAMILLAVKNGLAAASNALAAKSAIAHALSLKGIQAGALAAAKGVGVFMTSLGPIGWIAIAVSGIAAAFSYMNIESEKAAELAKENTARLDEALKKQNETIASNLNSIERLKELQKYEKLNNKEREEAKRLLEETGIAYDENGRSIDEMISRQGEEKRSLAELIEMRKKELKERRIAALEEQINARKHNIQTTLGYNDDMSGYWADIVDSLSLFEVPGGSNVERINGNNLYIQEQWNKIKKLREELQKLKKDELSLGETEAERNSKNAEAAVRQREALKSLSDKEWDIKFNSSSADKQNSMLSEKIDGVFSEYKRTGKYQSIDEFKGADRSKMTEQELNDLQKIVDLEAQRANLRKQSATAFESERESYGAYLKNLEKQKQERAVDREIEAAKKAGDLTGVDAIMQREFAKARDAANAMKREYERALNDAEADGILTEAEKKKISELRRSLEDANSAAEKYATDKITSAETKQEETKRNSDAAGAFNSKILASIFGQAAPMEETAKNTRRTAEYVREMLLKNENSSLRYS